MAKKKPHVREGKSNLEVIKGLLTEAWEKERLKRKRNVDLAWTSRHLRKKPTKE